MILGTPATIHVCLEAAFPSHRHEPLAEGADGTAPKILGTWYDAIASAAEGQDLSMEQIQELLKLTLTTTIADDPTIGRLAQALEEKVLPNLRDGLASAAPFMEPVPAGT